MEIIIKLPKNRPSLKAVLFDFDGTISTLRYGWESIMEPMMLEMISANSEPDQSLIDEVKRYIDQSTGIQTIYQMQWLAEAVKKNGQNLSAPDDPWWYKAEYNRRLMVPVEERKALIRNGKKAQDDYLIKGSITMLAALKEKGIKIFVASGTDDADVKREAKVLGVSGYFDIIAGAPAGKTACSKEAVLKELLENQGFKGGELAVVGDGKVEIALGREVGAVTLGLATDEEKRFGINETKRQRIIKAGAHAITGDFTDLDEIISWLGL